jgi:hypothetical protein
MSPADISCYRDQLTDRCSVIFEINDFLTIRILSITEYYSHYSRLRDLRKYSAEPEKGSNGLAHGPYANMGGTREIAAGRGASGLFPGGNFGAPDQVRKRLRAALKIDVRQGIAGMRRHVAPALLLC